MVKLTTYLSSQKKPKRNLDLEPYRLEVQEYSIDSKRMSEQESNVLKKR